MFDGPEVPCGKDLAWSQVWWNSKFHLLKKKEIQFFYGPKPYLILMDFEAPPTKNFILVWIEMKICKPLENCLGLEMIWKLSFDSKRYPDEVTLVVDMNPIKICVKALSPLLLYKQNWVVRHVTYAYESYGDNKHQKQKFSFWIGLI